MGLRDPVGLGPALLLVIIMGLFKLTLVEVRGDGPGPGELPLSPR